MAKNDKNRASKNSRQETKQHDDAISSWAGLGRKVGGRRGEALGRKADESAREAAIDRAKRDGWW